MFNPNTVEKQTFNLAKFILFLIKILAHDLARKPLNPFICKVFRNLADGFEHQIK